MKLKEGLIRFIKQHKVGLLCFLFLVLYEWLIISNGRAWSVNPVVTYPLYTFDYSMGFSTRILPGAVYHLFGGVYDTPHVNAFVTVFFLLLLGLLAYFTEQLFTAADAREKKTCLVLAFFLLTGPFTFSVFVLEFGLLDFYWVFFCAAAIFLLPKKRLKWLIPLCIFGMFLIHFAAIFCCAAVVLVLLFFFGAKAEDRAEKKEYYVLFALCFVVTVGSAWYFIQHDLDNLTFTVDEFNRILRERNVQVLAYADAIIYRQTDNSMNPPDYYFSMRHVSPDSSGVIRLFEWIVYYVLAAIATPQNYLRLLFLLLLELPAVILLIGLMISYFKENRGNWEKRLAAFLMIGLFFGTTAVGFLLSSDTVRWIDHAFMGLFACASALLVFDYRAGFRKAGAVLRKIGFPALAVYALTYSLIIIDPYLQY